MSFSRPPAMDLLLFAVLTTAALFCSAAASPASTTMRLEVNADGERTLNETAQATETETEEEEGSGDQGQVPATKEMGHREQQFQFFDQSDMLAVMKACNGSFTIPWEFVAEMNETGSFPEEADRDAKCYVYCLLEQLGVVRSGTGELGRQARRWLQAPGRDAATGEMIELCARRPEADMCEKAYHFLSCFLTEDILRHGDSSKVKSKVKSKAKPANSGDSNLRN